MRGNSISPPNTICKRLMCIPERKDAVIGSVNQWLSDGNVTKAGVYAKAALQLDENDGDLWFLMGNVMQTGADCRCGALLSQGN